MSRSCAINVHDILRITQTVPFHSGQTVHFVNFTLKLYSVILNLMERALVNKTNILLYIVSGKKNETFGDDIIYIYMSRIWKLNLNNILKVTLGEDTNSDKSITLLT